MMQISRVKDAEHSLWTGMLGFAAFGAVVLSLLGARWAEALFGGIMLGAGIGGFAEWLIKQRRN